MEIETENTIINTEVIEIPVTVEAKEQVVTVTTEENVCTVSVTEQKNIIETKEEIIEITTEENPVIVETFENITINNITSSGNILTKKAGEAIGGHRVVKLENDKAYYADSSVSSDAYKVAGITTGATEAEEDCLITTYGEVEEVSWSWEEGKPIFLGGNGILTQTCPETGFILQIATVINLKKIFINIKIPLIVGGS